MSDRVVNHDDGKTGFGSAVRFVALHAPASLTIATCAVVAIYLLDKASSHIAAIVTIN